MMESLLFSGGGGLLGGDNGGSSRGVNALHRRAQQLKRWQETEEQLTKAEKEGAIPVKHRTEPKIRFSNNTLFLAACAVNDYEECRRLLKEGLVDIDCTIIDGLTALHQACIDDNIDMVQFLIDNGADVNCADHEGWTPLHATASCGHASIAQILLENGADPRIVNNDGELASDIADNDMIEELIVHNLKELNTEDFESLRKQEQFAMMQDVNEWLKTGKIDDRPHPRSGATILHVAAAKGYIDILSTLLNNRTLKNQINLEAQDNEGWTPLAAACYWQQPGAVELLVLAGADVYAKTSAGQNLEDLTDHELIISIIQDRRKKLKEEEKIREQERLKEEEKLKAQISNGSDDQQQKVSTSPASTAALPSESETQRKAHAKRVRETRRSTQGISADDVNKAKDQLKQAAVVSSEVLSSKEQITLESEEKKDGYKERIHERSPTPPSSVTSSVEPSSPDVSVTDSSNPQLIRRKRPKRRSTGACPYEDIKDAVENYKSSDENNKSSVPISEVIISTESDSTSNALSSNVNNKRILNNKALNNEENKVQNEQSILCYKKLYEDLLVETEAIKRDYQKREQEWNRERRQLQRKLTELEEELKQMDTVKTDNQRLKDENGALIRVISKLSK